MIAFITVSLVGLVVVKNSDFFKTEPNVETVPPFEIKDTSSTTPNIPIEPPPVQKPAVQQPDASQDFAAIAASSYIKEDLSQTLMGIEPEESDLLYNQAARLYGAQKYREALKLLKKPDITREYDSYTLRGYTYYHMGQFSNAEADLRKFREFHDSDRKLDVIWCEVFCLTKQLPSARARLDIILKEITANPNHPYFDLAKALEIALQKQ